MNEPCPNHSLVVRPTHMEVWHYPIPKLVQFGDPLVGKTTFWPPIVVEFLPTICPKQNKKPQ